MTRIGAAALIAVFTLSFPAGALAQSAGDEQYRDPFAGQGQQGDGGGEDTGSTPAPAPTTAAPPTESGATSEPVATTAGTLPRTGAAAFWVAGLGLLLLAAGAGLRRTARA